MVWRSREEIEVNASESSTVRDKAYSRNVVYNLSLYVDVLSI